MSGRLAHGRPATAPFAIALALTALLVLSFATASSRAEGRSRDADPAEPLGSRDGSRVRRRDRLVMLDPHTLDLLAAMALPRSALPRR